MMCLVASDTYDPARSNFHVASFTPKWNSPIYPSPEFWTKTPKIMADFPQQTPPRGFQCKSLPNSPPLFGGIDFMTVSKPRSIQKSPKIPRNPHGIFRRIQIWDVQFPKFCRKIRQRNTRGREVWPSERSEPSSTCRNLRKFPNSKMLEFGSPPC